MMVEISDRFLATALRLISRKEPYSNELEKLAGAVIVYGGEALSIGTDAQCREVLIKLFDAAEKLIVK